MSRNTQKSLINSGTGMWVSSHCSGLHAFHGRHSLTIHCIVLFRHNKLPISWRQSQTGTCIMQYSGLHISATTVQTLDQSKLTNYLCMITTELLFIKLFVNNKLLLPSSFQHVFLVIVLVAKQQRNRKAYYTDKVCVQSWACHTSRWLVCSKLSLEYE